MGLMHDEKECHEGAWTKRLNRTRRRRRFGPLGVVTGILLAVAAYWVRPDPVRACDSATQLRLVPLGTQGKRLVLLELQQGRDKSSTLRRPLHSWTLDAALRFADVRGRLLPGRIMVAQNVAVHDHRYTKQIRPVVRKALNRARRLVGFRKLGRPRLAVCGRGARCVQWQSFATRTGRFFFSRRQPGKPARLIRFAHLARYIKAADTGHETWTGNRAGADVAMAKQISLGWVLSHRWGKREVVVINLSHRSYGSTNEKGWSVSRCRSVSTCVPPEPDGDHHVAVDVLMVLEPTQRGPVVTSTLLPKAAVAPAPGGRGGGTP